jgi:hypothetical protein
MGTKASQGWTVLQMMNIHHFDGEISEIFAPTKTERNFLTAGISRGQKRTIENSIILIILEPSRQGSVSKNEFTIRQGGVQVPARVQDDTIPTRGPLSVKRSLR